MPERTDTERLVWLVEECTYKQLELLWKQTANVEEFREMIDMFMLSKSNTKFK